MMRIQTRKADLLWEKLWSNLCGENPQPSQSGKLSRDSQNLLFFLTPFTDFKTNTKAFGSNDSDEQ